MTTEFEVVVIGAGVMGSAAAWRLAAAGKSVLVLEQHTQGHSNGASHGATRALSAAYADDAYQELLTESRRLWSELEAESGTKLLDWVGLVQHGGEHRLRRLFEAHGRHGVRSEFLSADHAADRWRGMRFVSRVLFTHDAARFRADNALRALHDRAISHGAVFKYGQPVRRIESWRQRPIVHTDNAHYGAEHVVVTAGAWTRAILPADIVTPPLRVTQEQPAHFAVHEDVASGPNFMHSPELGLSRDDYWYSRVYGMFTPGEGLKVGWHGSGDETDPDRRTFAYEPNQMDALRRYVREWLPAADPDQFVPISCTYTTTPTEDFILDRRGAVVVGAGFSGHGFKFAPVIGQILADLATKLDGPAMFRLPLSPRTR